ncbi:hypothetical protein [Pedobacter antarcticus]|uniref:hypothetical protein n=1 Tax=Pedobacter antarcticus TaxID=34086 RepID=UPI001C597315|nr:hypothetical protein [Pedobacter antarcticus]
MANNNLLPGHAEMCKLIDTTLLIICIESGANINYNGSIGLSDHEVEGKYNFHCRSTTDSEKTIQDVIKKYPSLQRAEDFGLAKDRVYLYISI